MKKTFVIQIEYPDCDTIPSDELIEVTKESFEHLLSRYFGANIMDGDYDRIKVKEVTDGFSLVNRMREAQSDYEIIDMAYEYAKDHRCADRELVLQRAEAMTKAIKLEDEVDEYLKKMEEDK